jgi:hypothetical protein
MSGVEIKLQTNTGIGGTKMPIKMLGTTLLEESNLPCSLTRSYVLLMVSYLAEDSSLVD